MDDIAAYLEVKRDMVYKWIEHKYLPALKIGRLWKLIKDLFDQRVISNSAEGRKQDG